VRPLLSFGRYLDGRLWVIRRRAFEVNLWLRMTPALRWLTGPFAGDHLYQLWSPKPEWGHLLRALPSLPAQSFQSPERAIGVLGPNDYADIVVTVEHPWGDLEVPLSEWIDRGPGPRPYVRIGAARRMSNGEPIPLSEIPLEYHNSPESRRRQRAGQIPPPWGPPPEEPQSEPSGD